MYRIGSSDVSEKQWKTVTILSEIEKLEQWSQVFGASLIDKISLNNTNEKVNKKNPKIVGLMLVILWAFALKYFLTQMIIQDKDFGHLLMYGDLALFYGSAVNRLFYNTFLFCWGFHAAIMYTLMTRGSGHKWLQKFDDCWTKSNFRAQRCEDNSLELIKTRVLCGKFLKMSVICGLILMISINVFGAIYNWTVIKQILIYYIPWSFAHILWSFIASLINMTALFHHLIFCKSIIIRFREITMDLDFTIRGTSNGDPWIISRLLNKHYTICDMVMEGNRYLKNYLFVFFAIFVPMFCYFIYQIFFSKIPYSMRGVTLVYALYLSFQIVLVALSAARITSKAHDPYHIVHGVGKMSLPEDVQLQVTLFLQRLSGTAIGLTILDTFVITGGVLSSIITAIVTYFSIIVEMN